MRGLAAALALLVAWVLIDWVAVVTGPFLGPLPFIGFVVLCLYGLTRLVKARG